MPTPLNHPNLDLNKSIIKKQVSQKSFWKEGFMEFFHNYFIGISHLSCSNENCPLVLHWDEIEENNSKRGKCCFLKITKDKFLVVKISKSILNGLKELVEVEIEYEDGSKALVRNREEISILTKNLTKEQEEKLSFVDPQDCVYFFNNPHYQPNLAGAEGYLEEMWEIREKIRWDRKASKKKIINWVEQKPDGEDKSAKINEWEDDYIFYIPNPDITSEVKAHEVYSTQNTKEREQLWFDYKEELSELRRVNGIQHITSKKEERMNNPEIEANQAQFLALERRKKRIREVSVKDFENKGFCLGNHTLSYGSYQEHQQELELENLVENQEQGKNQEEIKPAQENFVLVNKEQ